MKALIVKFLAKKLPDHCVFEKWWGIALCKYNPLYDDIMKQKMINKGYINDSISQ